MAKRIQLQKIKIKFATGMGLLLADFFFTLGFKINLSFNSCPGIVVFIL